MTDLPGKPDQGNEQPQLAITDDPRALQSAAAEHALIGRERIRGATRMIPAGTEADAVTPEQITQVAADLESFMRTFGVKQALVAKAVGYAPTVISEFVTGSYRGNKGRLAIDVDDWLAIEEERRARPSTTQFVWTNAALRIKSAAGYCLTHGRMGMVHAPDSSGIGKTTALRAMAEDLGPRRCALVTIDKVDCTAGGLLQRICEGLQISAAASNKHRQDAIVKKIAGRSHLLIVDQVHNLRFAKGDTPLYILADIWERTRSGQLWSGTARMYEYLFKQQAVAHDESLAQIRSRIFPIVDVMQGLRDDGGAGGKPGSAWLAVTVEQIREIYAKNTLRLSERGARFLCQIANSPDSGCLRLCTNLVEYATYMAEQEGARTLDESHLREAMTMCLVPSAAELLLARVPAQTSMQRQIKTA